jgi:acetyl esterase/lipase
MADQVRRAIAWTYKNAASFDGDPDRLYIGGHSSGGHLCGVALVTDWKNVFGLFGIPGSIAGLRSFDTTGAVLLSTKTGSGNYLLDPMFAE